MNTANRPPGDHDIRLITGNRSPPIGGFQAIIYREKP